MQALQLYDQGLQEDYRGWSSSLDCRLEYTDSQNGLILSALNEKDFARVNMLKRVCGKLDFDLYLSRRERCANADDYGNQYATSRQIKEYLYDLEGQLHVTTFAYPDPYDVDGESATDAEDLDDSEQDASTNYSEDGYSPECRDYEFSRGWRGRSRWTRCVVVSRTQR